MKVTKFFSYLETKNSEVGKRTLFKSEYTTYIPDFCFILLCTSLFLVTILTDLFFIYVLLIQEHKIVLGVIFSATIIPRLVCECFLEKNEDSELLPDFQLEEKLKMILKFLGLRSFSISATVLAETFMVRNTPKRSFIYYTFPVFHITSDNLSVLKCYYCINVAVKSIPQLFVMCIYVLDEHFTGTPAIVATSSIIINSIVFSIMITGTFPIRKSPKLLTTTFYVVLSAFNKFFAAMCACLINVAVFSLVYQNHGYYAVLVQFVRCLIWSWPCWRVLQCQTLSQVHLLMYFILLALISSFIYIHPFEGEGKLYYYFFYLLNFTLDLTLLYMFNETKLNAITSCFALRTLMIGFLSTFELVNILHKYKTDKYGCVSYTSVNKSTKSSSTIKGVVSTHSSDEEPKEPKEEKVLMIIEQDKEPHVRVETPKKQKPERKKQTTTPGVRRTRRQPNRVLEVFDEDSTTTFYIEISQQYVSK